jgi:hypothetical protein
MSIEFLSVRIYCHAHIHLFYWWCVRENQIKIVVIKFMLVMFYECWSILYSLDALNGVSMCLWRAFSCIDLIHSIILYDEDINKRFVLIVNTFDSNVDSMNKSLVFMACSASSSLSHCNVVLLKFTHNHQSIFVGYNDRRELFQT